MSMKLDAAPNFPINFILFVNKRNTLKYKNMLMFGAFWVKIARHIQLEPRRKLESHVT